jgi:hypothetical protein
VKKLSIIVACGLAAGAIAACQDTTDPLPDGSQALEPPPVFEMWWALTESCSGRTGSVSDVQWYIVPRGDGTSYWYFAGNRIVLAEESWLDGDVVRHEMLHALLAVNRVGHPRDQFLGRCRGVVSCSSSCEADAGPAPPIAVAETITPAGLELSVEIMPQVRGTPPYHGHFAVIVTARNPANHAVNLHLPASTAGAITFGFRLVGELSLPTLAGNARVSDAADTVFTAGETKRHIFDFAVGNPPAPFEVRTTPDPIVVPGTYRVDFGYGSRWTAMANALIVAR